MDFIGNDTNIDEVERTNRTLWVGNLHPDVSQSNLFELFYQVGPVEYVEFAVDDRGINENFAWVVFKHLSSVEDSIKLFCNTKLYGIPIIIKNYSQHSKDPVFHEQLDYFKRLINVERNKELKEINKSRWNGQNYDKSYIPGSLPEPPTQSSKNSSSLYQHDGNSFAKNRNSCHKNEHHFSDKIYRGNYSKSDYNSTSDSMEMFTNDRDSYYHQNYGRDSYRNQNYDRKHQDYNNHASYNRRETKNRTQESPCVNEKSPTRDVLPVRDLRDTMYRKRPSNYNNYPEKNMDATCKPLDLRDTLHHRKGRRYEDSGQQYESDANNRWSEKNLKNPYGGSGLSDRGPRKNYYNSERFIESNTRHPNHNYDRNSEKSSVNLQEHEYPNNYSNKYNQEKYTSYNNKYNYTQSQNMESNSHQYNPYKRNDEGHKKKDYKNSYDEESEIYQGRNYNKRGTNQSRQHFHS